MAAANRLLDEQDIRDYHNQRPYDPDLVEIFIAEKAENIKIVCEILKERVEFYGNDPGLQIFRNATLSMLEQLGENIDIILPDNDTGSFLESEAGTVLFFAYVANDYEYIDYIPSHYRQYIDGWIHIDEKDYYNFKAWSLLDTSTTLYNFTVTGLRVVMLTVREIFETYKTRHLEEIYPGLTDYAYDTLEIMGFFDYD